MTAGATRATRAIEISPVTGTIGAELRGVDLASPLREETVAEIRAALLANRVIFFRDQSLDYESQVAFARRLGTLTLGHPTIKSPSDKPLMEEVDSATGAVLWQLQPVPWMHNRLPRRQPPHHFLNGGNRHRHGQQVAYIVFAEEQSHGNNPRSN